MDRVRIIKDAFTEDECKLILGYGLSEPLLPAYSPGMSINPDIRSSMVNFIYPIEHSDWLFDRFWSLLGKVESTNRLPFLQFSEYSSEYGGHFNRHTDTENFYHPTNTSTYTRKYTCVVQASDPAAYEGGTVLLHLPQGDVITPDPRGSAIIFPSDTPHTVTKVTSGIRYSLVGWFEGLI